MSDYRYTDYFEQEVLRKRPYLQREWCIRVIETPLRVEWQEDNRWRFWARIEELEGPMKLAYHKDTDSLYIDLAEQPSVESRVVSEGIVLDYGADGNLVGIDIDNASRKVQLGQLELSGLQGKITRRAG